MSDTDKLDRIAQLLEKVRDNQREQLERQAESLAIQKDQYQAFLQQHDRTAQLQQRAEAIQERSARLIGGIQRVFPLALALTLVLIGYITWILWRYLR